MGDGVQHFHIFGVGIVAREIIIELDIERDHFAAELCKNLRRKGARRAIAASRNHFQLALDRRAIGEIGKIARRKIIDIDIAAARPRLALGVENNIGEAAHFIGAESDRALHAHFHARPAIVIMRSGDHGDAGHIEFELRKIGHRRKRQANVMHFHATRHEAGVAALRDDGYAVARAGGHHRRHFGGAARPHDRESRPSPATPPIGGEGLDEGRFREAVVLADDVSQALEEVAHGAILHEGRPEGILGVPPDLTRPTRKSRHSGCIAVSPL